MEWAKWVDIFGGLSLFILNLIINNRIIKLELSFQQKMTEMKESIQENVNSKMLPRAEFMQCQVDITRRMDAIDRHLEATDKNVQYIHNRFNLNQQS